MFVSIELYTFLEVYIYAGKIYNLCGEDLVIQSRLCITDAKNNLPATKYKQSKILHVLAHRFFELYQILAEQKETQGHAFKLPLLMQSFFSIIW